MRIVLAALVAALVGCTHDHAIDPAPVPDAVLVVAACSNLRSADVRCPEGFGSAGGVTCEEIVGRRHALKPLPLACWSQARDSAEAIVCGNLRCIR